MIQVVLDTNILASGAVAPAGGTLATIVDSWQAGLFGVVLSAPILGELERTLGDPYFARRLSAQDVATYLTMVRSTASITPLTVQVKGIATHPEDDLLLATALSGKVDYLVTGDSKLQRLGSYQGVCIVSPRQYVAILQSRG